MADNLIYKQVPLEIKQFADDNEDPSFHYFEGFASTIDQDLAGDIIEKGAFVDTLTRVTPIILWQHDMRNPIGMPMELMEVDQGLFVKARMPKEDTLVAGRVAPQMRVKSVKAMSIGFTVDEFEIRDGFRYIQKLTLWEISLVTLPMNPKARVTNFKAATPFKDLPLASRDREWDSDAAMGRVRSFTDSEDEPSSRYKDAFLWYDRGDAENFGAYKLPFADVIDGTLTAVPRGIFAAAAAMRGARGGVDIPDADRPAVERHINRYYDKMGIESPFEKSGIGTTELEVMTKKDVEEYLRNSGLFSRKASKYMASQFTEHQCDAGGRGQCDAGGLIEDLKKLNQTLKGEL